LVSPVVVLQERRFQEVSGQRWQPEGVSVWNQSHTILLCSVKSESHHPFVLLLFIMNRLYLLCFFFVLFFCTHWYSEKEFFLVLDIHDRVLYFSKIIVDDTTQLGTLSYESRKWELKTRLIHEDRCDERLKN
jgi:hypothetical protein